MNIIQVYAKFPSHADCIRHLEKVRWKGIPRCPYCQSVKTSAMPKEMRHHCNTCNTTFSVTVQTIFHNSKLDLQKWFLAVALIVNAKKGLSARQLARDLEVNKNTAWFMGMRIRKALVDSGELLRGIVEVDETYIGGKPRKGGPPRKRGRGTTKTPVVGAVERNGNVKAKVMVWLDSKRLTNLIRGSVDLKQSIIMTDEFKGYSRLAGLTIHKTVNHSAGEYVKGDAHTNTIEGFWALLKRGITGQYHKVSLAYLQKYIDEFAFRYNNRKNADIFELALAKAIGG
ncbi:MAG: IS1595 family transposase [Deltaproteobacteria bacterium]|nr:IS1595 family transposase [Deltaproteobacteria bacterium]